MSPLDTFAGAWRSLATQKRRTALSLCGVAIGVAAVLVLTGLGEGARTFVRKQFEVIGTNVVAILPGKVETSGGMPGFGGVPNDLTIEDAEALARGVHGAERVAPVYLGNETVGRNERSRQVLVFGSTAEVQPIRKLLVRRGTFLPVNPWNRGAAVAVIGSKLSRELFPGESPLGGIVRCGGWRMRVIGELEPQGVHFGIDLDETIFVPVATALRMFDRSSLFRIVMQLRPGFDGERAKDQATAILTERHGEEDFTITTPEAVLGSLESILGVLTLALAGIAAISLAVAGIGVMNVMLVSVTERTEEIGLMKAIGAQPRQILALFLAEAAGLSALGGLLGLGVGWSILEGAGWLYPDFGFAAPAWAVFAAFSMSVGVGVVFGLWPAVRAVRLDPVVAMSGHTA